MQSITWKSTTPDIMNQKQQPQVTHKEILQVILKQLLTLATWIFNKKYWVTGLSLSLPLPTNPGIDQGIVVIKLTPQMILTPATKEIVADAASGGAWTSRNTWRVSRTDVNRITPGNIGNAIGIIETPSPVIIGIIGTFPPCGLNLIQEVSYIHHSNPQAWS